MDFRKQVDEKIMCEDRADDFLSQFPLISLFHDDSVADKHLERWGENIGFYVIVLIVILIKFFDKIWVYNLN